jgi:tryptophan-rich sensory protein
MKKEIATVIAAIGWVAVLVLLIWMHDLRTLAAWIISPITIMGIAKMAD